MMASADEISITRCAPGKRTPKDQIRVRELPPSIIASSEARGLSGQTMLSQRQQDDEDAIKSVAANNPDRKGLGEKAEEQMAGSVFGRFVLSHYSDEDDRRRRFWAGLLYAQKVDNFQVASGLAARQWGKSPIGVSEITVKEAKKRKDDALEELERVRDVIREVDILAVGIMDRLCYDDQSIFDRQVGRALNALYKLSVFFKLEKRGYERR